jgi:hypothetical protein
MIFFPKIKVYYTFIAQEVQKTHFLHEFSTKNCKLLNGLNLVNVHQYHSSPKNSLQNSTHNLNFEVYLQFFIFYDVYF